MDKQVQDPLPFKVGQLAESRSFLPGYRSAWFRCKIKEIRLRKGTIEHALEFFDFPDEEVTWTRIYQVPQVSRKRGTKTKKELMLRPQYPPIHHESQMPHANEISEVTVVNNGVWKVGDLVDWLSESCYWSGRVTQILGDDKVEVELPPPPVGEGCSYEVFSKYLRPSLDWSPEHGWSNPTYEEGGEEENCCPCARIIKPVDEGIKNVEPTAGSKFDASFLSSISDNLSPPMDKSQQSTAKETPEQPLGNTISKEETQRPEVKTDAGMGDIAIEKTVLSHGVGNIEGVPAETAGTGEDQSYCSGSAKKMRTGENILLNSLCSDTIEAPIMDLEELANKVRWLRRILELGDPLANAGRPPWRFMEHRASSKLNASESIVTWLNETCYSPQPCGVRLRKKK